MQYKCLKLKNVLQCDSRSSLTHFSLCFYIMEETRQWKNKTVGSIKAVRFPKRKHRPVMVAGWESSALDLSGSMRGRSHSSHSTSWAELTLVQWRQRHVDELKHEQDDCHTAGIMCRDTVYILYVLFCVFCSTVQSGIQDKDKNNKKREREQMTTCTQNTKTHNNQTDKT